MEIIAVMLLILSGQSVSFSFGRLFLYWTYDVILMEVFITTFGLVFVSLIVFTKMGLYGFIFSLVASALWPYVFIKLNINNNANKNNNKSIIGCFFWLFLAVVFIFSAFEVSYIGSLLNQLYSLSESVIICVMSIFIIIGVLSIHMFTYEFKKILKNQQ